MLTYALSFLLFCCWHGIFDYLMTDKLICEVLNFFGLVNIYPLFTLNENIPALNFLLNFNLIFILTVIIIIISNQHLHILFSTLSD